MPARTLGLLLALLLLACGGDDGSATTFDTSSDDGTSSGTATTGLDTTTASNATTRPTTTSSSMDTVTGSSSSADGSSTSASESSTGGSDSSSSSGGTTGVGAVMNLDPDTLEFFDLPIGSLRYAVAGQDLASDTCVTFVWAYGAFGEQYNPKCATRMQDWPYVIVTPGATAPCTQWDYGGNVTVDAATGCVEFQDTTPLTAEIEMSVEVSNGPFEGTINVDNVP